MITVKSIVENSDTIYGKIFDLIIQSLILISIISFSIETIPNLSEFSLSILKAIEIICITVFTIEYLLRIIVADNKLKFIFSFYGLIDFLAILPFYLTLGVDLRSLRIFRFFRLIRIFKILRFSRAVSRFKSAFLKIKYELLLYLTTTLFLLYISSVGIYYFENPAQPDKFSSIFDCLWWSIETLTTIGYGEIYPITVGGKIFTSIIVLLGIGVVAVPTGLFASSLTKVEQNDSS